MNIKGRLWDLRKKQEEFIGVGRAYYVAKVEYSSMLIGESLAEAFTRNWGMYLEAVKNIPDEHWRTGDVEHLIPSRILYNVLECVDFYTNRTPEGFVWGRRFKIDWENMSLKADAYEGAGQGIPRRNDGEDR